MAYANDIRTAGTAKAGTAGFFSKLAERAARYRVYRDTLAELNGLSDRDLADLGMSRIQVKAVAYEAAYGA